MITTTIIGAILLGLGIAAKGLLASILIFVGTWLTKNSLMIWFLNTKYGKATLRFIRWVAYTKCGRTIGRYAYKVFGFIAFTYQWVGNKIKALINMIRIKLWAMM